MTDALAFKIAAADREDSDQIIQLQRLAYQSEAKQSFIKTGQSLH